MIGVLRRTVCDSRFDNLCGSFRKSQTTVFLRTAITQMIFFNQGMLLLGSNHFLKNKQKKLSPKSGKYETKSLRQSWIKLISFRTTGPRTIPQKVFREFDFIIMQNLSDTLPLLCTPTWSPHHVSENQEFHDF